MDVLLSRRKNSYTHYNKKKVCRDLVEIPRVSFHWNTQQEIEENKIPKQINQFCKTKQIINNKKDVLFYNQHITSMHFISYKYLNCMLILNGWFEMYIFVYLIPSHGYQFNQMKLFIWYMYRYNIRTTYVSRICKRHPQFVAFSLSF